MVVLDDAEGKIAANSEPETPVKPHFVVKINACEYHFTFIIRSEKPCMYFEIRPDNLVYFGEF